MIKKEHIRTVWILFKKELGSYFNSPIAYIFIAVFLIAGNWLFLQNFFVFQQASLRNYFSLLPWVFLFLSPALTMRLWAEERKSGTIEFLLSMPITSWQAVLAKFFGSLAFVSISILLTLTLPISISFLGHLDIGSLLGSYLGSLLLAGAYLSLGLFVSSLTKNQIVAFILGLVACFAFFIIGYEFVVMSAPAWLSPFLDFAGLGNHFQNISRGVIDSKDLIYYLSFIFFFLWLNVRAIGKRAWK